MPLTVFTPSALPSQTAPASNFVGSVQLTQLLASSESPSHQHAAAVTFAPCATSSWHYHPLGQLLVGVLGGGLVTERGGQPRAIQPGDVVWISPDTVHWHGAAAKSAFTQLAITEGEDDVTTEWLERATRSSPCVTAAASDGWASQWWLPPAFTVAVLLLAVLVRAWLRRRRACRQQEESAESERQEQLMPSAAVADTAGMSIV